MKKLGLVFALFACTGCVTIPPQSMPIDTEKRAFIYDFSLPGRSKADLFKAARFYMASAYGDVRSVSRLEDEDSATIIGKAVMPWNLSFEGLLIKSMPCSSNYNITFIAKDGKARLQLELQSGAPPTATCGWQLPPKRDYAQFPPYFDRIANEFSEALNNKGQIDKLNQF